MNIILLPESILRKKSLNVKLPLNFEDNNIILQMINYVKSSQEKNSSLRPGIGIAAVQLGYLKRMFYILIKNEENEDIIFEDALINPVITQFEGKAALTNGEGCLSIEENFPNQNGFVHRYNKVKVKAFSYFKKQEIEYEVEGFLAIVFQHEIDHLDGKLFIDRINDKNKNIRLKNEILI